LVVQFSFFSMKKLLLIISAFLIANMALGQSDSVFMFENHNDTFEELSSEFYNAAKNDTYLRSIHWFSGKDKNREPGAIKKKLTSIPIYGSYFSHYGNWETYVAIDSAYYYNQDDNVIHKILYREWGSPGEGGSYYRPDWKIDYIWENANRIQEVIFWDYDLSGNFYFYKNRMRYYYSDASKLSQIDAFDWQQNLWVMRNRTYYSYDIHARLTEIYKINYDAVTQQYSSSEKNSISYDSCHNSSTDIFCKWDTINQNWQSVNKTVYFNDSLNRPSRKECYNYNPITGSFNIYLRYDFNHSGSDTLSEVTVWTVDSTGNELKKLLKWNLVYGSLGELLSIENSYWNEPSNCFVQGDTRYKPYYDYGYPESALVFPSHYPKSLYQLPYNRESSSNFAFLCNRVQRMHFDTVANNWVYGAETRFRYTDFVETITPYYSEQNSLVFPNPAHNNVYVNLPEDLVWAEFRLYDLSGKLLIETAVNNGSEVALYSVKPGIYVYKIVEDDVNFTGKLVVE